MLIYILAGIGLAAVVGFIISQRKKAEQNRKQAQDRVVSGANITNDITGVGVNGVIKLPPFGNVASPIETYVKVRHRYNDEGGVPWYELNCVHGKRELLVEWSREGAEVYVTAGFEDENPTLDQLGLDEAKLVEFDDAQRGEFDWGGVTWHLNEGGERDYFAKDGREKEEFYAWEFESDDESRTLTVEKWKDDRKFYVYHQYYVDTRSIEVFDAGELGK